MLPLCRGRQQRSPKKEKKKKAGLEETYHLLGTKLFLLSSEKPAEHPQKHIACWSNRPDPACLRLVCVHNYRPKGTSPFVLESLSSWYYKWSSGEQNTAYQ